MAGIWTSDISTIVFSRIVSDFSEDLKTQYKMQKVSMSGFTTWLNFSTSQVSESPPLFPYITVIELPSSERAKALNKKSVAGGIFGFQVDVFDNQNETRAKNCAWEVARILFLMGFDGDEMPTPNSKPQEYRMTARFSRLICSGDIL